MIRRSLLLALLVGAFMSPSGAAERSASAGETGLGASLVAGGFRLQAPGGQTVDSLDLVGTPYAIFFGFLSCPDVCPTTLAEVTGALARMPGEAADLRIYFVSIDPADRMEDMARYTAAFDRRIVPLTGDEAAVAEAIRSFNVVVQRTDIPGGGHTFGHTAAVFLVDGDGVIVDRAGYGDGVDTLTAKLRRLVAQP